MYSNTSSTTHITNTHYKLYLLSTVYSGAQTESSTLFTSAWVAGSPCWVCAYRRLTRAPPRRGKAPSTIRAIWHILCRSTSKCESMWVSLCINNKEGQWNRCGLHTTQQTNRSQPKWIGKVNHKHTNKWSTMYMCTVQWAPAAKLSCATKSGHHHCYPHSRHFHCHHRLL